MKKNFEIMKRILMLLSVVMSMTLMSCAQLKVFKEVSGMSGVETVNVGKIAMQFAKKSVTAGDKYVPKDAVRDMEGVEIVTAGNPEAIEAVRKVLLRVLQEGDYQAVIESNGNGESSAIYTIIPPDNNEEGICRNILIVSDEPWELNIVLLKGTFNIDKIVSSNMNNAVPD